MGTYVVSRSIPIDADPARVHGLVNDFREWRAWSPWEGLDPDLERTYEGPDAGVGARYSWRGNRKAGQGSMEITSSDPQRIEVALSFFRPFKADNQVTFDLVPSSGGRTDVTWTMTGEQKGLMGLLGKVVPMDKLVGKDFEKGLAQLKSSAEGE